MAIGDEDLDRLQFYFEDVLESNVKSLDSYNKPSDSEQRVIANAIDGASHAVGPVVPAAVDHEQVDDVAESPSQACHASSEEGRASVFSKLHHQRPRPLLSPEDTRSQANVSQAEKKGQVTSF